MFAQAQDTLSVRSGRSVVSKTSSAKKNSNVDETLFRSKGNISKISGNTAFISKSELEKLKQDPNSSFVNTNDLKRIQAATIPQRVLDQEIKEINSKKSEDIKIARQRRERIRQIDERKKKLGEAQLSDLEQENAQKDKEIIENAIIQIDEQNDDVKHMNSLALYAQCVTIRDMQIKEKVAIEESKKVRDLKLDSEMEIERLKALRIYEERDKKRVEDRKKGAQVIVQQIKERELARLREQEIKEQEQKAMLEHIEKMKLEDIKESNRKKDATKKLLEEVALANAEQILLKQRQKEAEIEEDLQITAYNLERQQREEALAQEQERIRAEKEREVARLRAMQEKAQDKQAELDALRAKRAQEDYERQWRRKTREEAEKRQKMNRDLAQARERQKREKEDVIAEQARLEREQFERIIEHQLEQEELEKLQAEEEKRRLLLNANQLNSQITNALELQEKRKREYLEEGERIRKQNEIEKKKIEIIRQKKIQQLEAAGIPSKYTYELKKKKLMQDPLRAANKKSS